MNARAFTVVETLIAIGLLLMLSAALSGFLFDVQGTRDRLSTLGDERLTGALVIDAIEEAARFAVASTENGAGITGDRTSLTIAAQSVILDSSSPDRRDLGTVRVRSLAWDDSTGVMTLDGEPLAGLVRRVVLRYHDGEAWGDAFDSSSAGGLPSAIEVALWFGEPEGDPDAPPESPGALGDLDLGEGFGLPTPRDLASLTSGVDWGEPDRRRVVAIPVLRGGDE